MGIFEIPSPPAFSLERKRRGSASGERFEPLRCKVRAKKGRAAVHSLGKCSRGPQREWSVSRILCLLQAAVIALGSPLLATSSDLPGTSSSAADENLTAFFLSGLAGGHPGTPGLRWPPTGVGPTHRFPIWSCTRWGLSCRLVSPPPRCALTAPFHPCHPDGSDRTRRPDGPEFGGLFSVTLSLARGYGAPAPSPRTGGRYPPPCPVVFGLSCPRHAGGRPPDHSFLHYTAGRQVWRRVAGFSGCMRMSAGKSARSKRCKLGSPQSDCR